LSFFLCSFTVRPRPPATQFLPSVVLVRSVACREQSFHLLVQLLAVVNDCFQFFSGRSVVSFPPQLWSFHSLKFYELPASLKSTLTQAFLFQISKLGLLFCGSWVLRQVVLWCPDQTVKCGRYKLLTSREIILPFKLLVSRNYWL